MFNPFGGEDTAEATKPKQAENKPYATTGVSARDNVRKMLFETFIQESGDHSEKDAARAAESIEDAVSASIKDPKSRQYRDKVRQIQLKLKVSSYSLKIDDLFW